MSTPVRARQLTPDEGRYLLRLVRRGVHDSVRYRRALIIMASASGTRVPAIARLIAADSDTVRDVIHAFNTRGLVMLAPRWGHGRPRRITDADIEIVVAMATTRPARLGLPFTHWSIRKLTGYLNGDISFQHTRTWKTSTDPAYDTKLDRIDEVMSRFPGRCFAFDQFGPLSIRPCHGTCWAARRHPDRLPATYHRAHGIRYFHGCYNLSEDKLWGVLHEHKSGAHTLAAFKTIRAARPDGAPIYIICDNLSASTTPAIRAWAAAHKVELCLTPTSASWANPIEAQFGPLRMFTMVNSNYPNHVALARAMHAYLRWRNANNRHPDVIAAQSRERARIRSEHHHHWGRPPETQAA
jgi:transposase